MKLIDFHSHILPRVDHGSDSIETSKSQIEFSKIAGIDTIIATPHFYPHKHNVSSFITKRDEAYNNLISELNPSVDIILGAEILLCEQMQKLPGIELLTVSGTNSLLIELPFSGFDHKHIEAVEKLIEKGFTVILAHAERYDAINIENLIALGAKIQLNASALSGLFIKRHVLDWIERGIVFGIGSDIHMKDRSAYKKFGKALSKLKENADVIMQKSEKLCFK